MSNLTKLYNFFTTKYYDNIKYNHFFANSLRIFFERANKTRQTVSNLGNVYRNSKWSDLKVQNIKISHTNQFYRNFLIFLLSALFLFFVIFRLDSNTLYLLFSSLVNMWYYVSDIIGYWLAVLFVGIYNFIFFILKKFGIQHTDIIKSFDPAASNTTFKQTNAFKNGNLFSGSGSLLLNNETSVIYSLFKLKSTLDKTGANSFFENYSLSVPQQLNNALGSYILSNNNAATKHNTYGSYSLYELEKAFSLTAVPEFSKGNNKVNLNLALLNQSSMVDHNLSKLLNLSVVNNLNIAKESRWFLKNSPITERLGIANFSYTQAKNLIGSPTSQSNYSDSSVWAAANINNIKNPFLLSSVGSTNTLAFNSLPQLTNINDFELSSFWFSKRNYFTLQPKFYLTLNTQGLADLTAPKATTTFDSLSLMQESINLDFILSNAQLHFNSSNLSNLAVSNSHSSDYSPFLANTNINVFNKSLNLYLLNISINSKSNELSYTFFKFLEPSNISYTKIKIN